MITKFDSPFAGRSTWTTLAMAAPPSTTGASQRASWSRCSTRPRPWRSSWTGLGYDTFWMAEHHFQHEGYECIPNVLMLAVHLAHVTRAAALRLRLQHHADVASAAAGRGLRRWPTS